MLVLSRQRDERIVIGDDVEVVVVDIRGDKVRLGIVAPNTVSVHRKEIYEAIRRENQDASGLQGDVTRFNGVTPGSEAIRRLAQRHQGHGDSRREIA
ncbi:MAG: carbon storage regulator CsrA [Planctomycetes bacterium]|jgi:carbon storage regulator|nr:carbon storage regulator CsrA [Planctomycetota bacterium]